MEAINMCFDLAVGVTCLRVAILGYVSYRLISKVNWPLAWYYMRGGDKDDRK
jgi:hypothetical protein